MAMKGWSRFMLRCQFTHNGTLYTAQHVLIANPLQHDWRIGAVATQIDQTFYRDYGFIPHDRTWTVEWLGEF